MTRQTALATIGEMERHYLDSPYPGNSPESIQFFEMRARQLALGVKFELEESQVVKWARIFYSGRRWEKWGNERIRTVMYQSISRVRQVFSNTR